MFKYSLLMVLSIKMELGNYFEIFNQRRIIIFVFWINFSFKYLSKLQLKIIFDFFLFLYFISLPIIQKLGLRMSNYKDNKKMGLKMHHHLPKRSLSNEKSYVEDEDI